MRYRPYGERCGESDGMSDCMADTMVELFTGAAVYLKCQNGAGHVSAASVAYACIFAKDYADMIGNFILSSNLSNIRF